MKNDEQAGPDNLGRAIGSSMRRPELRDVLRGRATYVDDITLPGLLHVAFLRSPHAHADILSIDVSAASAVPGVVRILTGEDIAPLCRPLKTSKQFPGMVELEQLPMPVQRSTYQGEPIAVVIAESRAIGEDAVDLIDVDWKVLQPAVELPTGLRAGAPRAHPQLDSNLAIEVKFGGEAELMRNSAVHAVEACFSFARVTGAPMEARGVIASFLPSTNSLTIHQSHAAPHVLRSLYAYLLDLEEADVRVICPNVGGSFGIKIHMYADEIVTCAISKLIGRPVKFIADRLESFTADIHAREHQVTARLTLDADGYFTSFEIEDLLGIGPYSNFPLSSAHEGVGAVRMTGAPYKFSGFRGRTRAVLQNKAIAGQIRGVGHPIACTVTEHLVDQAARLLKVTPEELRRKNFTKDVDYPYAHPAGPQLEALSHEKCLDKLLSSMNIDSLRQEQRELRSKGVYRGIGMAAFVEVTAPGGRVYGNIEVPLPVIDGISLHVDPSGSIRCAISVTDQGQGTHTAIGQVVAEAIGVPFSSVRVISGDSAATPHGSGASASRTTAIGGELALKAGRALKMQILDCAAPLLQTTSDQLSLENGKISRLGVGPQITLKELSQMVHFKGHTLPAGSAPAFSVSLQFGHDWPAIVPTNGIQASYLEVDPETGIVKLLQHWAVDDFGTIVNPLLAAEQVRGGIAQGIGEALYEELRYSHEGQLTNASLVEYMLPKASDLPDIVVQHVETPWPKSELGAKGAGEAGATAALGAILNAVNSALAPFECIITDVPITPARILTALAATGGRAS